MKRKFHTKRCREAVDVDITSLLDILTILLVFLLKSYNASDLKLDLKTNLDMAKSEVRQMTTFAPVIQVNKGSEVFLNSKKFGRYPASGEMTDLISALKELRNLNNEKQLDKKHRTRINHEMINLVFDRDMDYGLVQRIMHASALAGYSQFKFIVKGDD